MSTIGQFTQLACEWEVLARKAGNVCPGREFPDLTVADFLKSAAAIAPIMDQAPFQPLGVTILRSIEATRRVVNTNTNLGIVLLLAPLAAVPLDQPLEAGVAAVLARTTVEDSRNAYAAIRLANPGGLGRAPEQDIADEPTLPLREVMRLAIHRDLIATQYVMDFAWILEELTPTLVSCVDKFHNVERGVIDAQLLFLFDSADSLVIRKIGPKRASEVQVRAHAVLQAGLPTLEGRRGFVDLDAWLRSENHLRNPGTTADLIAAALFVALREKLISPAMPFTWAEHPFAGST